MELHEIVALLERFDASSCTALRLEQGEFKLKLDKTVAAVAAPVVLTAPVVAPAAQAAVPIPREGTVLNAPLVGTFYTAPAQGEAPFVRVGDQVKKGQTVCVLEAMKMMSEVPAPCDCVIEEVLVSDGELVGFEAPLFRIREV